MTEVSEYATENVHAGDRYAYGPRLARSPSEKIMKEVPVGYHALFGSGIGAYVKPFDCESESRTLSVMNKTHASSHVHVHVLWPLRLG